MGGGAGRGGWAVLPPRASRSGLAVWSAAIRPGPALEKSNAVAVEIVPDRSGSQFASSERPMARAPQPTLSVATADFVAGSAMRVFW